MINWMIDKKIIHYKFHKFHVSIKQSGSILKIIYNPHDHKKVKKMRKKIINFFKQNGYIEFTMPKGRTLASVKIEKRYRNKNANPK